MKIVKRFENATFDTFICETDEQRRLVEVLRAGVQNGFTKNIIILGSVGVGKTHLAYAVLNALAKRNKCKDYQYYSEDVVCYRVSKAMIDEICMSWKYDNCGDPVFDLSNVPLLIIDEVGVDKGSDKERKILYDVFNNRYNDMKPTIVISNCDLKTLQNVLGQRIYDRLSSGTDFFELSGKSFRQGSLND